MHLIHVIVIGQFAPSETWEQCFYNVWGTVQVSEDTSCQTLPLAQCLLSSAQQQRGLLRVASSSQEECTR